MKDPNLISVTKRITKETTNGKIISSIVWRHPQVISFHNDHGELINKCLDCNQECDRAVNEKGGCICSYDWQPKEEDL